MEIDSEGGKTIHLQASTKIHGLVVPTWFAVLFLVLFCAALFVLTVMHQRQSDIQTQDIERGKIIEREIRLLQLHAQAVQNTLIQNERAKLEDFPPLESPPKK